MSSVKEVVSSEPRPLEEPVFCEHYEALRLELETLYGNGMGSVDPQLTMTDVASFVIHCLM